MSLQNPVSKHTAAGQFAGYLFQPERALFHLANSKPGAVVGIETLDDIAVLQPNGKEIREQAKHSVANSATLANSKKGIWRTLDIWLSSVEAEELDLENCELQLVTNTVVADGFAHELMTLGRSSEELKSLVLSLRKAGNGASKTLRELTTKVLAHNDNSLCSLLARVTVIDQTQGVSGDALKTKLATSLPLPANHEFEILQSLLGWVHDTAIELIREGKPAWLNREAFVERYLTLVSAFHDRKFLNETSEALIPVSDDKRLTHRQSLFVNQLLWVGIPESDEQLIEAIDDFIRSSSERVRLAKSGIATLQDFRSFEERLVARWRNIFRKHHSTSRGTTEDNAQSNGRSVLFETLDHRESLGGYETQEWYLTRGAYHRLADRPITKPKVGWHHEFQTKCNSK